VLIHDDARRTVAHGLRALSRDHTCQARYRGLAQTSLDHNVKAAALNLVRLDAWWDGEVLGSRRNAPLLGPESATLVR
jgi:hypothetical protein